MTTEKDYHQRFRERFGEEVWCKEGEAAGNEIFHILAFVDLEVDAAFARGYEASADDHGLLSRAALIEHIKSLLDHEERTGTGEFSTGKSVAYGEVLKYLRANSSDA